MTLPISFEQPRWLWLVAPLALVTWMLARRSLSGLSRGRWIAAVGMRVVVLLLLVMALAGAQWVKRHDDLTVVYLVDLSRSVPKRLADFAWDFVRKTSRDAPPRDRVAVVGFDGQPYIDQLPQKPGVDGGLHVERLSPPLEPDRSDLSMAMRMAMAMFPGDSTRRIVLLSDGNETQGDVIAEARNAVANGVALDIVPLRYEHRNEVMFEKMVAPAYAALHDNAALRLLLRSEQATTGTVTLFHDGKLVDLDPDQPGPGQRVSLQPGVNPLTVRLPLNHSGAHRWEARFEPDAASDDEVPNNNVATAFTTVEGGQKVLVLQHDPDDRHSPEDDAPLLEALAKEHIEVEAAPAGDVQLDPVDLQEYSAIVLANVPADALSEGQHTALTSYVRDMGGGLVLLGGDESFGAGGWQGSPIEEVSPVRFDVDEKKEIPRGALAVLMHSCEAPQGNLWGIEVCIAAMKTLSRLDYFGIVNWGGMGFEWAVPMRLADDKKGIERRIRQMANGDMGDFDAPLNMIYKGIMSRRDAAQRHVIVVSDGDPAPPTAGTLQLFKAAKITITTVSIFPHGGWTISTLKNIAEATGGRYYQLSNPGDEKRLPQIFIKEARIVRRPLIREEGFRPRITASGAEIMENVGREIPRLLGHVVTTARSPAEIEMPLTSDKGDPVLAYWQAGLGRSVAFTSGWWPRWGPDWPGWSAFSKLWAQSLRWCMAQGTAQNYEVVTRIEGDRGKVVIEALNKDAGYLNFLQLDGVVLGPDGKPLPLKLSQTGPGKYEAEFAARDAGTYLVNVQAKGGGEAPARIRTGATVPYSREFRELGANEPLLQQLAQQSPLGRILDGPPEEANVFDHNLPKTISRLAIWNTLLQIAVAMFLLDVAVRRVAIDPRAVAKRVRGFVADLAGRFAPGRRAEAVLGDLKGVRDRVREEMTAAGSADAAREASEKSAAAQLADRARKFEAAPGSARATGDLRKTLGGADAPAPGAPKPKDPTKPEAPAESMTSRLLKAKRRALPDDDKSAKS